MCILLVTCSELPIASNKVLLCISSLIWEDWWFICLNKQLYVYYNFKSVFYLLIPNQEWYSALLRLHVKLEWHKEVGNYQFEILRMYRPGNFLTTYRLTSKREIDKTMQQKWMGGGMHSTPSCCGIHHMTFNICYFDPYRFGMFHMILLK